MRSLVTILGALALASGVAAAQDFNGRYDANPPPATVVSGGLPIKEQRLLYNTVKLMDERFLVCNGHAPLKVTSRRTAGDITAAIVSLGIWTPTHARVIC